MDVPLGRGDDDGSHDGTRQQDCVPLLHSINQLREGLRQWSDGEYSDEMSSNISTGQLFSDAKQMSVDPTEFDGATSRKGPRMMNSEADRERTGRQSNHQHHDQKKSRRKSKKKKKSKKKARRGSSSSSSCASSRSRSRSRSRYRRRHRSRSWSRASESYSDEERWMPRRARQEGETYRQQVPNSSIMIRGLSTHVGENDISLDIMQCGIGVRDIRLIRYRETGLSRGFAFVDFHDIPDAVKYMELRQGTVIYHDQYEASMIYSTERNGSTTSRGTMIPGRDWYCAMCSAHNFKKREVCYRCQASKVEDGIEEPTEEITKYATTTVLLKNLDMLTTEDSILQAFELRSELGSIPTKSVKISRESGTNLSRGVCFVETNSVSDAVRLYDCLTCNPLNVDERILSVAYCKPPIQAVAMNSVAAAALAAAQWSVSSSDTHVNPTPELEIQQLAEYSASLYAKNPQEKESYLAYYLGYYRNQHSKGEKLTAAGNGGMNGGTAAQSGEFNAPSTSSSPVNYAQPNRSASPDMNRLQFDESTSYYYDPLTLLYYDGSSKNFYDSKSMEYLSWDVQKREYVALSTKLNSEQSSSEYVQEAKPIKINVSKSILKDTLKQAIKFNEKKNVKMNVKPASSERMDQKRRPNIEKRESLPEAKVYQTSSTTGTWVAEAIEKNSDSEEEAKTLSDSSENFIDLERLACTLCKRQFQSYDILLKHTQLSDLHKTNLVTLQNSKTKVESISIPPSDSGSTSYRDRAKERRNHFGVEFTETRNSLKDLYEVARTANDQTLLEESVARGIKKDNVGCRLLEKMGWKSGMGLGKHETGRTDIIPTEMRVANAGLGMPLSQVTKSPASSDRYSNARHLTLARYRELDEQS